jgi:hypothetical protein
MASERRVLAKLIARYPGTTRGLFELADGRTVEADGVLGFESDEAPRTGEKALIVTDGGGKVLRWEPYAATRLRPDSE